MIAEISSEKKHIIFMMGSPGAGKSYVSEKYFAKYFKLDSDTIKQTHPNYDPKNPSLVHNWSRTQMEKQFQKMILEDKSFIVDGTGANSDKMVRQITEAISNGFDAILVYVTVTLKTALKRNKMRERFVPEGIVCSKYQDIGYSFNLVAPHANQVIVINNE